MIAENKLHSLYIWIHLKPTANVKECAKAAASLQSKVKHVEGPDADDDDSIAAGVGFGPNFYKLVGHSSSTAMHTYDIDIVSLYNIIVKQVQMSPLIFIEPN